MVKRRRWQEDEERGEFILKFDVFRSALHSFGIREHKMKIEIENLLIRKLASYVTRSE